MSKYVYLIGAGASYGERIPRMFNGEQENDILGRPIMDIHRGLPIVSEIGNAIDKLIIDFELEKKADVSPSREMLKQYLLDIKNVCAKHSTIDAYAKQLYTSHRFEEYYDFKAKISIAFMLWQKMNSYDYRYEHFFDSIIKADTGELPELTILSWNYDIQFEIAYSPYIQYDASLLKIWENLNIYSKTYPRTKFNPYKLDAPFSIIKLNGSALFHSNKTDDLSMRFTLQDILWSHLTEKQKYDTLLELYNHRERSDNPFEINSYVNGLSYSWERNKLNELKDVISKRINDAETLIMIGYSLPNVNNDIDDYIFNSMPNLKTIYVQDKNFDVIKERIEDFYTNTNSTIPEIKQRHNLQSFYIPNDIIK